MGDGGRGGGGGCGKFQFICSTHPIASFLSTDKFLCFDGDKFGLFNPWRSSPNIETNTITTGSTGSAIEDENPNLTEYLNREGAFILPPINEQRQLMEIFINKIYPFFPVIDICDKDSLNKFSPLLLNSIFLVASRCLSNENNINININIRQRCQELFERCKLLELNENNKIALIQSFLLMSIHEEGINGSSLSKEYITRACNLCGDLGITTLSGSNGTVQDTQHRVYKKLYYGESILTRLFWISYCCDILSAATHAREVYYNMNDVFIGDVPKEFPELTIFVELLTLLYRTLGSHYRPHKGRIIDEKLSTDIINWQSSSINHHPWLKLLHSYICMINLRCELDPITLDPIVVKSLHEQFINVAKCDPFWFKFHIVGVHSLLHVTSLLNVLGNDNDDLNNNIRKSLEDLKEIWWLAASGLKLFDK